MTSVFFLLVIEPAVRSMGPIFFNMLILKYANNSTVPVIDSNVLDYM